MLNLGGVTKKNTQTCSALPEATQQKEKPTNQATYHPTILQEFRNNIPTPTQKKTPTSVQTSTSLKRSPKERHLKKPTNPSKKRKTKKTKLVTPSKAFENGLQQNSICFSGGSNLGFPPRKRTYDKLEIH